MNAGQYSDSKIQNVFVFITHVKIKILQPESNNLTRNICILLPLQISLWYRIYDHAFQCFEHRVWVLVGIHMLAVDVEFADLVYIYVVLSQPLFHLDVTVSGILPQTILDLLRPRGIVQHVVVIAGYRVHGPLRESLQHRVIRNVQEKYSENVVFILMNSCFNNTKVPVTISYVVKFL